MALRDVGSDLVPEHVAVARRVGLGRARDDAAPLGRELEGVLDDALDARAREHGRLDADLAGMALMRAAADAGVLALGVLAHEHHVDIAGRTAGERARHALEQPHGTDVGPQVEALADRQQQPPSVTCPAVRRLTHRIAKRAIDSSEGMLGEQLGKLYAERYFPPENKAAMEELVGNLRGRWGPASPKTAGCRGDQDGGDRQARGVHPQDRLPREFETYAGSKSRG